MKSFIFVFVWTAYRCAEKERERGREICVRVEKKPKWGSPFVASSIYPPILFMNVHLEPDVRDPVRWSKPPPETSNGSLRPGEQKTEKKRAGSSEEATRIPGSWPRICGKHTSRSTRSSGHQLLPACGGSKAAKTQARNVRATHHELLT